MPLEGYRSPTKQERCPNRSLLLLVDNDAVAPANGNKFTAPLNWDWASLVNPANFTIQRANNATFTTGLSSFTAAGAVRSLTQNVSSNTTYYYRIRANDTIGGSSAWVNALPFPIRTIIP